MELKAVQDSPPRNTQYYERGKTPFTIVSAIREKTSQGDDMLKIVFEITDKANRSGKFTGFIFGNQKPIYRAFLACIGKPQLEGQEVDGSTFNGCRGVFLMGWNPTKGFNKVDAYLPFDKERKDYNRYDTVAEKPAPEDDWSDFTPAAAKPEVYVDDIPF